MSERLDADVRIVMTAEDRASPEVQSAVDRINRQYRDMRNSQRAVGRGFELQHRTFSDTARALTSVGRVAQNVTSIYQRYNIMQLRLIESGRDLREAQENLNKAVAEYGPQSEQARIAARRLADEQRQNKQLQQENVLNNVGLGLSALTSVGTFTRGRGFGTIASKVGGLFSRGKGPMLNPRLGGMGAGLGVAGGLGAAAAGAGAGAIVGSSLREQVDFPGKKQIDELFAPINDPLSKALGFGSGQQKTQNININTNEIGVTADDIINGSDVWGE